MAVSRFDLVAVCHCGHCENHVGVMSINDDLHLLHIVEGWLDFHWGGRPHRASKGQVVYVPPFTSWQIHTGESSVEMINIHYHHFLEDGTSFADRWGYELVFGRKDFFDIERRLWAMSEAWDAGGLAGMTSASAIAMEIVATYVRTQPMLPAKRVSDMEMVRVKEELERDKSFVYQAEPMASAVGLSVSQMNRRFRQAFGVSPKQYWQEWRYHRATSLLRQADRPIATVAEECGFDDQNYFSRWFRQRSGQSPRTYRSAGATGV